MFHCARTCLAWIVLGWCSGSFPLDAQPTEAASGPVRGVEAGPVRRFLGIPYAEPPVGTRRWKAPVPHAPWTAPRAADAFGSPCVQVVGPLFAEPGEKIGQVKGSEDCLYLNVYAPSSAKDGSRLATMVWIHGGGFLLGSGGLYDPTVLVEKHNVVVVTINYRLGSLGFLALPGLTAESGNGSSGNYGLLDQQLALAWVQKNIAAFGGDPGNVTVFGESAGGLSICAHLASPSAAGLFRKAIIQSGLCGAPNNNVTAAEVYRRNAGFAHKLGCPGGNIDCLRKLSAATLEPTAVPGRRPLANLVWSPVYETPLLPRTLPVAFARGEFNRVPILNGTNHDEGRLFVKIASPNQKALPLYKYWGAVALFAGITESKRVLDRYPARRLGSPALAFASMFTDAVFSCSAFARNNELSQFVPVYAFEFDDPQAVTELSTPPGIPGLGSFHSSSLVYAFQSRIRGLADPARFAFEQRRLSDQFSAAWVNFAKTGVPASASDSMWSPFRKDAPTVWSFKPSGGSANMRFADEHHCGFWSGLNVK